MLSCQTTRLSALLAGLTTVLLLATCGGPASGQSGTTAVGGDGVLMAQGVSREAPREAPVEQTVNGLTKFGHDLYTVAADPAKNTVISPVSIGYAFGMARAGAGGQAASQLDHIFGFPASGPHAAFNDLDRQIGTAGRPPPRPFPGATRAANAPPAPPVVAIANGLFIQDGLPVTDGFLWTLASQYGAGGRIFSSGQGLFAVFSGLLSVRSCRRVWGW